MHDGVESPATASGGGMCIQDREDINRRWGLHKSRVEN